MTYLYGMQSFPAIGGGLGGLPRRIVDSVVITPSDPYFSNVSLLLHSDSLLDSSSSPKTITAYGNAAVKTAQSKFGGKSLYFDNDNGSRLEVASSVFDFGTLLDFTVEFWIRQSAWHTYDQFISQWTDPLAFQFSNISGFICVQDLTGSASSGVSTTGIQTNTWHHFAFVRYINVCKFYLNGIGYTLDRNPNISPSLVKPVGIGRDPLQVGYGMTGHIDELRVTNGVARYTANFTPPTEPFLDR